MHMKWWVLVAVACGTFMATLDSSIVNIALPTFTRVFGITLEGAKWVSVIYLLTITCLLLPLGKLSDIYGRKQVFQLGYSVFTMGSLACALSSTLTLLLISRFIQAVGAAMMMANGPALIAARFPDQERGMALGTMAMVVSAGLITGPSIGGLLIAKFGWSSIFTINIPLGILGITLVGMKIPRDARLAKNKYFDFKGAFLQSMALITFLSILDPPKIQHVEWALAGICALFVFLFVKQEMNSPNPLLSLTLIRNRTFWSGNLAGFLMFVSYSSVTVLLPFFFEDIMKYAPDTAGLLMSFIPLTIFLVAPISGRLSDRYGCRGLSILGAGAGLVALLILSGTLGKGLRPNLPSGEALLLLVIVGLSLGIFQSPNNNAIMSSSPLEKMGTASAIMATVRNLGMAVGTGLTTALFTFKFSSSGNYIFSLHFTHRIAAIIAGIALIAAALKQSERKGV